MGLCLYERMTAINKLFVELEATSSRTEKEALVKHARASDPLLKDENDKFLADDPKYNKCCYSCNHSYVISFRICQMYGLKEQCDLIQKKVLELRKSWLKK